MSFAARRLARAPSAISRRVSCDSKGLRRHFRASVRLRLQRLAADALDPNLDPPAPMPHLKAPSFSA